MHVVACCARLVQDVGRLGSWLAELLVRRGEDAPRGVPVGWDGGGLRLVGVASELLQLGE